VNRPLLRLIAVLALSACASAQSHGPAPRGRESKSHAPIEKTASNQAKPDDVRGTPQSPVVVGLSPIPKSERETADEQTDRQQRAANDRWNRWLTGTIAAFTLGLIWVGWKQRETYEASLTANKVIERAYVKMSHNRPGLRIDPVSTASRLYDTAPRQDISVDVKVQNSGNTPATVSYHLLQLVFTNSPLPTTPDYDPTKGQVVRVHLVKDESFNIFMNVNVEATAVANVQSEGWKLYLLGYVDYIDKFKGRHRSGYARVYNPSIDANIATKPLREGSMIPIPDPKAHAQRNNLPFVTQPGYNYDRPRVRGEGDDWQDPQ